jgi:hypothetical protein
VDATILVDEQEFQNNYVKIKQQQNNVEAHGMPIKNIRKAFFIEDYDKLGG